MPKVHVKSSNIKTLDYDSSKKELVIEFIGEIHQYKYSDFPEDVYKNFVVAESVGKFFHANVKGKYKYSKEEVKEEIEKLKKEAVRKINDLLDSENYDGERCFPDCDILIFPDKHIEMKTLAPSRIFNIDKKGIVTIIG